MDLKTPIRDLDGLFPAQRVRALERFGLPTVGDLLNHYPRRYEDRRQFDRFPSGESDAPVCVCGTVAKTSLKRFGGWRKIFELVLVEPEAHALSSPLVCRWFNMQYIQKLFSAGQRVIVYGRPKAKGRTIYIDHPEFEVVETDDQAPIHLDRIVPIYPATEGLSQRILRQSVHDLLGHLALESLPDPLPAPLRGDSRFGQALRQIHFPESFEAQKHARRHLVLLEFFKMQLALALKRAETVSQPGANHCGEGRLLRAVQESLPFPLTGAQRRAIAEIRADLARPHPMNRLLHGDVGSGKTLVALAAMLLAVESGAQAALMAPTQILAEQHYLNFTRLLAPLDIPISLRTGSRREESGARPGILLGTHALLHDETLFSNLGLVVIDEQHKFGVLQRARLIGQGCAPDVLVMSATPIPRTLSMTIYGDLDVSVLDEMPANRGKIITAVRDSSKLPEAAAFLRKHLEAGRQAYIVYPLIDQSEKLQSKAAAQEFDKWRELLSPMPCELLHGRVSPEEKDAIMDRFRRGETKALISTTVIEVGIDVANANLMLVENAERFGLAQLHQLRGRIGRGSHKSYCILLPDTDSAETLEKLRILESTSNGFEIAEADLRLRGPGDILGTAQSGLPPLKLGDLIADMDWMRLARSAATEIVSADPKLERAENKRFRPLLQEARNWPLSQVS